MAPLVIPPDTSGMLTTGGVAAISVVGAISKTTQWRDGATGKVIWSLLIGGIATCLILASVIRAIGLKMGIDPWYQIMATGVLCWLGPDPILRAVAGTILKRFGIEVK
jgi:hypothetical protein